MEVNNTMRTFYPRKTIMIDASEPHPVGTQYKVSIGDEDWGDGTYQTVTKVQMMYDGKVAGRMSPSYPAGTDDYERVCEAIFELESGNGGKDTYMIPTMLTKYGIMTDFEEIRSLTCENGFMSCRMVPVFDYMFYHLSDDVKVLCDYKPDEGCQTCDEIISILEGIDTDDDTFPTEAVDMIESIKHLHDND